MKKFIIFLIQKKLLNRPLKVEITDKSGIAGIAYWINSFFDIPDNEKLNKDNESIKKIKEIIDKEYENGRVISMSEKELIELTKKYLPDIFQKYSKNIEE